MEVWFRRFCWISIFANFPAVNFQGCMSIFLSVLPQAFLPSNRLDSSPRPNQQDQLDRLAKVMPDQEKMAQLKLAQLGFPAIKLARKNGTLEWQHRSWWSKCLLDQLGLVDLIKFFLVVIPVWIRFLLDGPKNTNPSIYSSKLPHVSFWRSVIWWFSWCFHWEGPWL